MTEEKLEKLLDELADATVEPVGPELAEDIKHHIPHTLTPHKGRRNTINIIIDLRVSKLAAAAIIIITMILLANLLGDWDSTGGGIYQESKLLMKYWLGGDSSHKITDASNFYEYLLDQGKEVVYYGDSVSPEDSNAVLIHWKLPDGRYTIVLGDLRKKTVSAEELIKLQARMLKNKAN